jgi:hypothetical protein
MPEGRTYFFLSKKVSLFHYSTVRADKLPAFMCFIQATFYLVVGSRRLKESQ